MLFEFSCYVLINIALSDPQIEDTEATMPHLLATVENVTRRLGPFQYLKSNGLYNALHLNQLKEELQELQHTIDITHNDNPSKETIKLTTEVHHLTKQLINSTLK